MVRHGAKPLWTTTFTQLRDIDDGEKSDNVGASITDLPSEQRPFIQPNREVRMGISVPDFLDILASKNVPKSLHSMSCSIISITLSVLDSGWYVISVAYNSSRFLASLPNPNPDLRISL
ncbi:hypothetical protein BJX63DRAFT_429410 [Aspergillus granulosus]|uniref:Uncharacterized protein n=1 Tax=Aspergillus granulosus TaxID=176169 RepID=A0ABR4HRI0_9EURO